MTEGLPRDLRSVAAVFGRLGWTAIGGPAVHVALMEREVVRKRHWLNRSEFGRLFATCNLLPGPGSTQLALVLGLRRAGVAGMLLAALLFIGPAVLVMLILAELYLHFGADHHLQLVLLGVDAAVVGIVVRAAVDLSSLARRGVLEVAIAAAALAAGLLAVNPLVVLACGGVLTYCVWLARNALHREHTPSGGSAGVLVWLAAAHAPAMTAGLVPLGLTFLKIGAVAFGSGYVLLPFLHADFVGGVFHLTDRQVADAFGVSQVTPGPVFAVAAFIGVQIAGIPGGLLAALAIFVPSLLYALLVNAFSSVTEAHTGFRIALDGVIVAAVGLIASACITLGRAAFAGPIEVAIALVVLAVLVRWPRAQPAGVAIGLAGGLLIMVTGP